MDGPDANDSTSSLSSVLELAASSVEDDRYLLTKADFEAVIVRIQHPGDTLKLHNTGTSTQLYITT